MTRTKFLRQLIEVKFVSNAIKLFNHNLRLYYTVFLAKYISRPSLIFESGVEVDLGDA
jgi:hypothetical protein